MLGAINARLHELLEGDNNPPELAALVHLRGTLIWWKQGLIEPGDWSLRSFLPALVSPAVVASLRDIGFWKPDESATRPLARIRQEALPHRPEATPPAPRA